MKTTEQTFSEMVEEVEKSGDMAHQHFLIETSEIIYKEMKARNLTKRAFANFLGISQAYLTDILKGNRSTTIQSRAKILYKLGYEILFNIKKKEENG